MRPKLVALLVSALAAVLPIGVAGNSTASATSPAGVTVNWSTFGFDNGHTNHNPHETTLTRSNVMTLAQKWSTPLGDANDSAESISPVVADGVAYAGSYNGVVTALSTSCGSASCAPLWTGMTASPMSGACSICSTSLTVADGIVYVGARDGLYAFGALGCGASTCSPLWRVGLVYGAGTPTVSGDRVYVGSGATLYVLHALTGRLLWSAPQEELGANWNASPAVAGGYVFVHGIFQGTPGLLVYPASGCGAVTCAPLWETQETFGSTSATVANGLVYDISACDCGAPGTLSAFSANGCGSFICAPLWSQQVPTNWGGASLAIRGHTIYAAFDKLYAFDATIGTALWSVPLNPATHNAPTIANDVVYLITGGKLHAFSAATGASLATVSIPGSLFDCSAPVLNGRVYVPGELSTQPPELIALGLP